MDVFPKEHYALHDSPELPTHSAQEVLDTIAGFGYPADEFRVTEHKTVMNQEPAVLVVAREHYYYWVTNQCMIPLSDDPRTAISS